MNRTITASQAAAAVAFAAIVALGCTGCLERKETIVVRPDGSIMIRAEFVGDPSELGGGDAWPDRATGWKTEDSIRVDDEGKEKLTRQCQRNFRHDDPLPDSYAEEDSPLYEVALRFPTKLTMERRRDGAYFHFERRYEARAWARFAYWQKLFETQLEEFSAKEPEELTDDDRRTLLTAVRGVEARKHAEYVAIAAEGMEERWTPEIGLRLRQAVLDYFGREDLEPMVKLLADSQSAERDERLDRMAREFLERVPDVLVERMDDLDIPRREADAFLTAYDREKRRLEVTEDLRDEKWEIRIRMPGEIIAHNADEVDGNVVTWRFPAEALMDREQVLQVTSRTGRGVRDAADHEDEEALGEDI